MLTKNEITALSLSPTKKDFVQIWNELLEVAGKLSERWDPTSTNESDPGIVILKALTGITDKLNYNIDKNTLEAFMPTAAQEDSMRKLCDMLGYNVKYYRSAETEVTIRYYNADPTPEETEALRLGLEIPKFTVITNSDKDVNYFTTNQIAYIISETTPSVTIPCMEGQIVKCESLSDNNVITASQISETNRFYLPETQIAENGIFVYNVVNLGASLVDGAHWTLVDNLNTQMRGSRVFKFGYDSYESRPYLEFPSDYSELINDGLFIYYARTSGANGNVSPRTLTQLEMPSSWSEVSAESFNVENTFSATTGANIETIKQAYNNFKKTIGTFETLVTCRDYMNKIYTMTGPSGKPLVSNVLVTDIRNDLNKAVTICSCDDAGIFYKDTPLTKTVVKELKNKNTGELVEVEDEIPAINRFDLVLYPFKSYTQIRGNVKDIQETYDSSFRPVKQADFNAIKNRLDEANIKTIAHNILPPSNGDIVCINNYLRLSAVIGTNSKVTAEESTLLTEVIKIALANAFNMRDLDFGEEIPFESIVDVIEKADPRIKVVSLNEPALYTTFSVFVGYDAFGNPRLKEYAVASDWLTIEEADASGRFDNTTFNTTEAKKIYNKLVVRNILAGSVPLFKYNTTFKTAFTEGAYRISEQITAEEAPDELQTPNELHPTTIWTDGATFYKAEYNNDDEPITYTKTYTPEKYADNVITKGADDNNITEITTSCIIKADESKQVSDVTLSTGEFVKFRAPNFRTVKTYPAYVNYHLALNKELLTEAKFAEAKSLFALLNNDGKNSKWDSIFEYFTAHKKTFTLTQKVEYNTQKTEFTIENPTIPDTTDTPEKVLARSGCVRLASGVPTLQWVDSSLQDTPVFKVKNADGDMEDFSISLGGSNIIVNSQTFENIKNSVNSAILLKDTELSKNDFTISFDFEYVPFEESTLGTWNNFVRQQSNNLFGFTPAEETGTILWRVFGDSYSEGKCILSNGAKLLPFASTYFSLLDNLPSYLHGIYVASSLGRDLKANFIENDEEYKLRDKEYLYIEYTPSTTTEDGTAKTQEPIQEVHGPGTIIRPSGFEGGLVDSSVYAKSHTPLKTVVFDNGVGSVALHSFGTNEQVEIREKSQVVLNKDLFADSAAVYVYKNFNNCAPLENAPQYDGGIRINNKYTLKDGEYIFYTDQNKAELAFFTAGTEVTLTGKTRLPKFDIIDLAVIFDSGLQDIPWAALNLSDNNGITFQEYQYTTLGPGDVLKTLTIVSSQNHIDDQWQYCDDVIYIPAGSSDEIGLDKINVSGSDAEGSGWEVSSVLELNVSPSTAQTLRKTDKVETSITLHKTSASGAESTETIVLAAENANYPLSFKTNLVCQSSNGKIKLDSLYTNTNKLESFELKVFSEKAPEIINTVPGSLVPYKGATDDTISTGNANSFTLASYGETWSRAAFTALTPVNNGVLAYDRALALSVSVLPNTYGIFSIYIDYTDTSIRAGAKTWLELLPGVSRNNITLFNVEEANIVWEGSTEYGNKLLLNPGINCIRVNTTCDIYLKTDQSSEGAVYFDELSLVDSAQIAYVEDGTTKVRVTNGFNLSQLGYLDTLDEDIFNTFDARVRKKLKSDYTANALAIIETKDQEAAKEIASSSKTLLASRQKVQNLSSFINTAIEELEALHKADEADLVYEDKLNELVANYIDHYEVLKQELDLKSALGNNKDVEELEQQLSVLLTDFGDIESKQHELLSKLSTLRSSIIQNSENLTQLEPEAIIEDFEASADTSKYKTLLADFKLANLAEINKNYSTEIADIEEDLKNINNETIKDKLEDLNNRQHAELLNEISKLTSLMTSGHTDIRNVLVNIEIAALGELQGSTYIVDYSAVAAKLIELRDLVNNEELYNLAESIETAVDSELYSELKTYLEELKALINIEDSSIIGDINSLLTTVRTKISANSTTCDDKISSAISLIKDTIFSNQESQFLKILASSKTLLADVDNSYTNAIGSINSVEDEQVEAIVNQLTTATNSISTAIETLNSYMANETFDINTDYAKVPFGDLAVLAIWPRYMKQALIAGANQLYAYVRKAIKSLSISADEELPKSPWLYNNNSEAREDLYDLCSYTDTTIEQDITIENVISFETLFDDAKTLANQHAQVTAREQEIEDLATLIPESEELTNALNEISANNSSARNAVICGIIAELKLETSLINRQQLIAELKEELEKVILIDTQLVEVSAKLLCPSILLLENALQEVHNDDFYVTLKTFVSGKRDILSDRSLLNKNINTELGNILAEFTSIYEAVGSLLVSLSANTVKETISALVESKETLQKVLSEAYIAELTDIRDSLARRQNITEVKGCTLLALLSRDLVVAWQTADENENWIDSTGAYFQRHENGSWADASGNWLREDGTAVKVDVKRSKTGEWINCTSNNQIVINNENGQWFSDNGLIAIQDTSIASALNTLLSAVSLLGQAATIPEALREDYITVRREEQLLADIRAIDKDRHFYYNAPIAANVAIEFNESDKKLNTLMNPLVNYDINNVNNCFVISKLDINYLTKGLQIARSSRLS